MNRRDQGQREYRSEQVVGLHGGCRGDGERFVTDQRHECIAPEHQDQPGERHQEKQRCHGPVRDPLQQAEAGYASPAAAAVNPDPTAKREIERDHHDHAQQDRGAICDDPVRAHVGPPYALRVHQHAFFGFEVRRRRQAGFALSYGAPHVGVTLIAESVVRAALPG